MSPYFLLSVLCSTAHASDVEPNDSQAQAVDAGANLLFRGTIDSSTDPDHYFTFEGSDGTYEVWLTEYGSTSVSLTLETSSGTVATASSGSSAHGLYLSATVSAGTTYYVHVSASSGSGLYRLRGRMVWDPPVISSISASSGSAGDSITLSGTDLGSSVDAVSLRVGGVQADVTSASGTSVDFTVPLDALDGYVELCHVGGCDSIAFSTGASSFSNPPWYTRPDPAELDVYGNGRFWMERVLVSYTGNVDTTDAETVMDDAVAALTNLTGYSEVGYLPLDNTYVWELTWNGSETLSDYEDLVDQLAAEADVDGLLAETPANTQDVLGFGMDVGMMWSGVQDEYAAHDLIGAEEAWRLLATSYPGTTLGEVAVHIIDSGMWNNADADGNTPFDEDHVRYFVKDASGEWAEGTLSVASDEYMSSGWSHGAAVASIIGTTNHQSPAWDGAEGTHGLSGILAGVQQYGVDDDGDGYTDLDDTDGEAFPFELGVWNFFTNSTESSGFTTKTNAQIY